MNEQSLLRTRLEQANIQCTAEQVDQLSAYMELVLEENKKFNLTAITQRDEFIGKHLIDSILMGVGLKEELRVLDLGTGGGFPGIPLKIMHPSWDMVLLDSTMKKVRFLDKGIETLGLTSIIAVHARAEELARESVYREAFDVVFSRAVAATNTLLEYCVPFAKVQGKVIAAKGPKYDQELKEAQRAMKLLYVTVAQVREVHVPGDPAQRVVITFQKEKKSPEIYPRLQGLPGKKPL